MAGFNSQSVFMRQRLSGDTPEKRSGAPFGASLVETRSDARSGTSLVETLVSMTLLGVIFIPMLFLSSAFFLAQLAKARQNVDVSVNSARFANQFMEELYLTQRVLPESTTTEIHFSYYDAIRQTPVKRGYRLSSSGASYRKLEKLAYDEVGGTWTPLSPYGAATADQVLLPGTAAFSYCDSGGCGLSAKNAVFVRLSNWEFMPAKNPARKVDFPQLDIYLSAGASAGGVMLAQAPQELYSFDKASSFGSGADLNLVHINPTGRMFNSLNVTGGGGTGGLTTIVDNLYYGSPFDITTDNRVFVESWSWKESTGLSTLTVYPSKYVAGADGRVFMPMGSSNRVPTWKEADGLSTILPVAESPTPAMVAISDGRVFFGESASPGQFWTWKEDTGLTTILPSAVNSPGAGGNSIVAQDDGRVFFGSSSGRFYTWKSDTGLTTILPANETNPGQTSTKVAGDGRVYFGETGASASFWTWKTGTGLTTILSGIATSPGSSSTAVAPDSRVFFGEYVSSGGRYWSWKEGTGAGTGLSTILTSAAYPGIGGVVTSDNRVVFGQNSNGVCHTWKDNVLATILNSGTGGCSGFTRLPDDRVIFSNNNILYAWKDGAGLSTLVTGLTSPSVAAVSSVDGRAYITASYSHYGAGETLVFYSWKSDTGLSTLHANMAAPDFDVGGHYAKVAGNGRVFFGEWGISLFSPIQANFYTLDSGSPVSMVAMDRVVTTGNKTSQPLPIESPGGSPAYTASYQDINGEIYFSDATGKTIDRYAYTVSIPGFERKTQFGWATSTGAVGAIAVDQDTTGIALLDTANKQIDIYNNRKATGSISANSQLSLAATTTPTGLAVSGRTGNYLVLDSAQQGTNPNKYVRLFVYDDGGTQITGSPWKIYLSPTAASGYGLSEDATGETAFKIQYDDQKNVLYLIAPSVGRVYALMLPEAF